MAAPFPADPHYDAKAWELCRATRWPGRVVLERGAAGEGVREHLQKHLPENENLCHHLLMMKGKFAGARQQYPSAAKFSFMHRGKWLAMQAKSFAMPLFLVQT